MLKYGGEGCLKSVQQHECSVRIGTFASQDVFRLLRAASSFTGSVGFYIVIVCHHSIGAQTTVSQVAGWLVVRYRGDTVFRADLSRLKASANTTASTSTGSQSWWRKQIKIGLCEVGPASRCVSRAPLKRYAPKYVKWRDYLMAKMC